MTKIRNRVFISVLLLIFIGISLGKVQAQVFDFERLEKQVQPSLVILEMQVEISFGTHTNEQDLRLLGTVVTDEGMIIFDGSFFGQDNSISSMAGMQVKTTPKNLKITTFDEQEFDAEYLGIDRFTEIGFAQITNAEKNFKAIEFREGQRFTIGSWVALYMLMPEFVSPPLAADIGMISSIVESPEKMPLTVGFAPLELASVLFDDRLNPVGILGRLVDPASAQTDASGIIESFDNFNIPLMGIITAERIKKMIASPPKVGKIDRSWLGITLQALTPDIAEFLEVDVEGGIIVNDVVSGSPAATAGLEVGDVIYKMNGAPIAVDREDRLPIFQRFVAQLGPGATVEFNVFRPTGTSDADSLILLAILEAAPISPQDAPEYENKKLEITFRDLVFADYLRLNQKQDDFSGVVASEMKIGGLAMLGGLRVGDVIQRISEYPVSTVEEVESAVTSILETEPEEIIFFVWRANKTMFVNVKVHK